MANIKISDLPAAATLTGSELLALVQSGATVQAPASDLLNLVIDAAPSALNTLNELAAALGDDANYAATVTTALGTKAPTANPTFTGVVTVAAGSASAPAVTTTGDTNTGTLFPAADTIAWATGGSERARIDSAGRLLLSNGAASVASQTWYTGGSQTAVTAGWQGIGSSVGYATAFYGLFAAAASSAALVQLAKSRNGTTGSHTVVNNADTLGVVAFAGSDGTSFCDAAQIRATVDNAPGTGSIPGRLTFLTVANAGTVPVERLRIDSAGGFQFNSGTALKRLLSASATLDFGSIAAAAQADLTITVTGAQTGDTVFLGLPTAPTAGIVWDSFVSAADTVTVRASNITAGAVDPASASYRATVLGF